MSKPTYNFPGITEFIAHEGIKPSFAVKIPGLFFVGRLVDALSQIPGAAPKDRTSMFAVADEAIVALKAAVVTAEAAYLHVLEACPPPPTVVVPAEPEVPATPEPSKAVKPGAKS